MSSEMQSSKEDTAAERRYFDCYYRENRDRRDPLEAVWIKKALRPSSRPLDYWEYTFYLVGDLNRKKALDIGCGSGWLTQMLALKGASISAIDISEEGCISTRKRLEGRGLPYDTIRVGDAHALNFPDAAFDLVFIAGVLHHVNIEKALLEVHRVLKPGGRVVCYEPLKYGPFMRLLKKAWFKAKGLHDHGHSENEEALTDSDLLPFEKVFGEGRIRKFNFLAKTNRMKNRFGAMARSLRWVDYIVLSVMPPLSRYCTCVVCCYVKDQPR